MTKKDFFPSQNIIVRDDCAKVNGGSVFDVNLFRGIVSFPLNSASAAYTWQPAPLLNYYSQNLTTVLFSSMDSFITYPGLSFSFVEDKGVISNNSIDPDGDGFLNSNNMGCPLIGGGNGDLLDLKTCSCKDLKNTDGEDKCPCKINFEEADNCVE